MAEASSSLCTKQDDLWEKLIAKFSETINSAKLPRTSVLNNLTTLRDPNKSNTGRLQRDRKSLEGFRKSSIFNRSKSQECSQSFRPLTIEKKRTNNITEATKTLEDIDTHIQNCSELMNSVRNKRQQEMIISRNLEIIKMLTSMINDSPSFYEVLDKCTKYFSSLIEFIHTCRSNPEISSKTALSELIRAYEELVTNINQRSTTIAQTTWKMI